MCNIDKFATTIQMLNNELASYTWARLTWEQRVTNQIELTAQEFFTESTGTMYAFKSTLKSKRRIIACETLSQMQF